MKIIIIEDEPLTAESLIDTILLIDSTISIVKVLHSVKQATLYFESAPEPVDLIFSDIQLGDGLSFEIFSALKIDIPIIFCTAYDEYALEAFDANSIHYILKPFDKKGIEKAFAKYKNLRSNSASTSASSMELLFKLIEEKYKPRSQSLLVYRGEKIIPIKTSDIAYFFLRNEAVYLTSFDHKQYTVNVNLDTIEAQLDSTFYRANRQFIINRSAVKEVSHDLGRKLIVELTLPCKEQIIISKAKSPEFMLWLKQA
jgi:two-component system, LytTR family, response regulator LytT